MTAWQVCVRSYSYARPRDQCWGVAPVLATSSMRTCDVVLKGIHHVGGLTYQPELYCEWHKAGVWDQRFFLNKALS